MARQTASLASRGSLDIEALFDQSGIVEMPTPDKCGGMSAPLAHGAGARNAHWPEQPGFEPISSGYESLRVENAAVSAIG